MLKDISPAFSIFIQRMSMVQLRMARLLKQAAESISKFIATLRKVKYSGKCSLEFEKEMKDNLPGIAESIGYFRGAMACGQ